MRTTLLLPILLLSLASTGAVGREFVTPEAAATEYRLAFESRDITRLLAMIDFYEEALEAAKRDAPGSEPDEATVRVRAEELKSSLRASLESKGFSPPGLDKCQILNSAKVSDTRSRVTFLCPGLLGPSYVSLSATRSADGWKIFRGTAK